MDTLSTSSPDPVGSELALERSARLAFPQSPFWVVHQILNDKTTLNHTVLYRITGKVRVNELKDAVRKLGQRHEALRTCFFEDETQRVLQGVLKIGTFGLEDSQVFGFSDVAREVESFKHHVYDLASGQTVRFRLLSHFGKATYLLVGFHHMNFDGGSLHIILNELDKIYSGQSLKPNPLQYFDFARGEREKLKTGLWEREIAFWKKEFASIPEPLPRIRSRCSTRRPIDQYASNIHHLHLAASLGNQIREVAKRYDSTAFHLYFAAFKVLLHRLTGAWDMCIGIADANRKAGGARESLGCYLDTLPIHLKVDDKQKLRETISEARRKIYSARDNRIPLEIIFNELRIPRPNTHNPLFQAFMDYLPGHPTRLQFSGFELERIETVFGRTSHDISLHIFDTPGQDLDIALMGHRDLYTDEDVRAFTNLYENILLEFVESPSKLIGEDWRFGSADIHKALRLGQGEHCESQWAETLLHQLEFVANENRSKVAIVDSNDIRQTYGQLLHRLDVIASALLHAGVKAGQNVAVFQEPTPDWIYSMLGIMKIGAVYVPLDPGTRVSRLARVVVDCKPAVILVDSKTRHNYQHLDASHTMSIDVSMLSAQTANSVPINSSQDAPAMILYTSGSTGHPKGIVIKHSSIRNEMEFASQIYGLDTNVKVLQQSSSSFDMSVYQSLIALSLGGTLCIVPRSMRGDSRAITNIITKHRVTHTCATPSEYSSWLRYGDRHELQNSSWSSALSGGEVVTESLLTSFRVLDKPDLRLFNGYGPTETTICSTKVELSYKKEGVYRGQIPAGKASPNEAIYIVDEQMRLLPAGLPGEIVIGGIGVALGYLKNEDPGAFIPNVYATQDFLRNGWKTMYRTKDRGRMLSDGCVFIEGRINDDTEVKLRGQRINLRGIEQSIVASSKGIITAAAVSVRSSSRDGSQFLVAHIVFAIDKLSFNREDYLRKLVAELPLPEYMCPAVLIPIDELPKTVSGKLDRVAISALPLVLDRPNQKTAQKLSDVEQRLKTVWEKVLPRDLLSLSQVGPESDFFHLGGTSLLLVEVQAHIKNEFGISIPLIQIFGSSTLGGMARLLDDTAAPVEQVSIDWDEETHPGPSCQSQRSKDLNSASAPPKVILLTDVYHLLGRHLLQLLIATKGVEQIICIGRQQSSNENTKIKELPQHEKVVYYEGGLCRPRLGLSEHDARSIFDRVDCVVHNGAEISHLKRYNALRAANVNSTKELVKLCVPRSIPLHYVSTVGVSLFKPRETFGETSAKDGSPPTDGSIGYWASRWASERYLERVGENHGLPVMIHRPSSIIIPEDDSSAGSGQQLEIVDSILQYSRKMHCVPLFENLRGRLDFVAVETVVKNIVEQVMSNKQSQQGATHFHHIGDVIAPLEQMKEHLECASTTLDKYEEIPIQEWLERAEAAGLSVALVAVIKNLDRSENPFHLPNFTKMEKRLQSKL